MNKPVLTSKKSIISIRTITVTLVFGILVGTVNSVSATDKKILRDEKSIPSAIEKIGPSWKDIARKLNKSSALNKLPDLEAIVETSSAPCTIYLQIRNNSIFSGLTSEQWSSGEDAVRLEVWDLNGPIPVLDEHDMRFNEVDPAGSLRTPNGRTLRVPWPVDPGLWKVVLIVDFAGAVREITNNNNEDEGTTYCPSTE